MKSRERAVQVEGVASAGDSGENMLGLRAKP